MPVATNSEWVNAVCRKLSQALGCDLSFHNIPDSQQHGPIPPSHVLWQASVHDGQQVAGHLLLRASQEVAAITGQPPAHSVLDAAAVFAEVLERLVVIEKQLANSDQEFLLANLGETSGVAETPNEIVQRLLQAAQRAAGCWSTAFFLASGPTQDLQLRGCWGTATAEIPQPHRHLPGSPDAAVMDQGVRVLSADSAADVPWLPAGCATALAVSVPTKMGSLGTLWCFERRQRDWLPPEIRRLRMVAAHLATGLERTVLVRESDARRRMSHELTFASARHSGQAMGKLPANSGLDVAIRTASSAELGGDLCEVWPIGRQQTLFAIGDATGHSVPAAMIMAVARGALRTLLGANAADLAATEILAERLNRALYSVTQGEQFMTLLCGVFDRARQTLVYTNAGHPPPWHIRQGKGAALSAHGMLLGVLPDICYERAQLRVQPGDWLISYTDGISEALSPDRRLFRAQGILDALGACDWPSAASAAAVIWDALHAHTGGAPATDDQTLLVMRITAES